MKFYTREQLLNANTAAVSKLPLPASQMPQHSFLRRDKTDELNAPNNSDNQSENAVKLSK